METPELGTKSVCYFCEEVIVFSELPEEFKKALFNKGVGCRPNWRHETTDLAVCQTIATPSNLTPEEK